MFIKIIFSVKVEQIVKRIIFALFFNDMTFILAIQLEDSLIVASDNHFARVGKNNELQHKVGMNKLYTWDYGIVVGTGEHTVIERATQFFELTKFNIKKLPDCLKASRLLREMEINHEQVKITKLMYSIFEGDDTRLYRIEPLPTGDYEVSKFQNNEIALWFFNPNLENKSMEIIKSLYENLKNFDEFESPLDWINFYTVQISKLFKSQAKKDIMMSESFNIFFQKKGVTYYDYLENDGDYIPYDFIYPVNI